MDNFKKKYNDLVEAVKQLQKANPSDEGIQNWVNDNVPELAGSEGERIRKILIELVKTTSEFYGNEWKIGDYSEGQVLAWLEKQGEQKPYGQREECLDCQFNYAGECKGSCAMKRSERKPTEWSEEDEKNLRRAIRATQVVYPVTADWLESIKQRHTWKPSDEQMHMLRRMITALPPGEVHNGLESLYNDLKKLTE